MQRTAVVVGAGITGAAAAWALGQNGYLVTVFERADVVGGHVRTEWIRGIPYEPHGAHIFHTFDEQIWRLVTKVADFVPYRHRVIINMRNRHLSWPLQVAQVEQLEDHDAILQELASRPPVPDQTNFETYCISLLGPTLFRECVHGYTLKQWGRDPQELSASVAVGRVELRDDGYEDLFRDPHQGWPREGYAVLVESLLESAHVHLGSSVRLSDLPSIARAGTPVIVTSALDDFLDEAEALSWRGVRLEPRLLPNVALAQSAMVVNEPNPDVPWTRTIETKWALPDLHQRHGTVVMHEYPGADAKHYPVLDAAGVNQARQRSFEQRLAAYRRNPIHPAGRLATYRYINMDTAIRSGLNSAARIIAEG